MKHVKIHLLIGIAAIATSGAAAQEAIPGVTMGGPTAQPQPQTPTRPLGLTQAAWNDRLRNRGEDVARPGYIRYIYDAQSIYPIRAREGMITTIKLPEDERISYAFSGDDVGFQVANPTPNSIAIKAVYPGVDTNIVAYAEGGKIYNFYVRSEGYNSRIITDFMVDIIEGRASQFGAGATNGGMGGAAGSQPEGVSDGLTPERQAQYDERNSAAAATRIRDPYATNPVSTNPRYREYAEWSDFDPNTIVEDLGVYVPRNAVGGHIPYRVFRDNRFTYVDYGPNATQMTEWPTPMIVIQGVEGPVGNRTGGPGGRMLIIEARGEFVLRNGDRVLVIKPRASRTDPVLVEYPVVSSTAMRIPEDVPPGRTDPQPSRPQTLKPVPRATPTVHNEAPSQTVRLPSEQPAANTTPTAPARTSVTQITTQVIPPARGGGAPIVTTNVAASNLPLAGGTVTTTTGATVQPIAAVQSRYVVAAGRDTQAALEDRWKSYRVDHYNELIGKRVTYQDTGAGVFEMRIEPVSSASEGMRLCSLLNRETACAVRNAR